jgi:hypothetical protein
MTNPFARFAPQLAFPIEQDNPLTATQSPRRAQNPFSRFAAPALTGSELGGLPPGAPPMDIANQSAAAMEAPPMTSPAAMGRAATLEAPMGGYLDKMRGEGTDLGEQPAPNQTRPGDALKPAFGGHNPVAEIFDTFIEPFIPAASPPPGAPPPPPGRPLLDRAAGLAATAASIPSRVVTQGQIGAGDLLSGAGFPNAGAAVNTAETDFAQANAPQLEALKAAGDYSMGMVGLPPMQVGPGAMRRPAPVNRAAEPQMAPPPRAAGAPPPVPNAPPAAAPPPMGAPSTAGGPMAPQGYQLPPAQQMMSQPSSSPARARAYVNRLDELGISRHGPAIAQAARDDNGAGLVAKVIEGFPIVSAPLRNSTKEFVQSAASAGNKIAGDYSPRGFNPEAAGGSGRAYFERFKNERTIDRDTFANMSDAEVHRLATTPPRDIGSLKTSLDARYEDAWREIPERFRRGGSQEEAPRLMSNMGATRAFLQDVVSDNLRMMNRTRLERERGADPAPGHLPTRQGDVPPQAIPFRGGVLGQAIDAILDGNWSGSLQTMRNIRSMVRRANARVADNEGNVLSKAQLTRLHGAISQDMTALMDRIATSYRAEGDIEMARAYERAARKMRSADRFTRRYAEAMEAIQKITGATTDYAVITALRNAALAKGGNSNLLLQVRRMAPPEVLDDLASGVLNEMWRPTGMANGATQELGMSISKFATQWNNMSPSARQLIFGHRPELYQKLNKFADVAQGMADWEKLSNTSRSGTHGLIGTALLAGPGYLLANINGVLLTGVTVFGVSHWLTSPAYVAWLTRSLKIQKAIQKGNLSPVAARAASARHMEKLRDLVMKDREVMAEKPAALFQALGLEASPGDDQQPPEVQH